MAGQQIVQRIISAIDCLRQRGSTVEIHWVPAYIRLHGNEAADKSAKEATGWRLKKLRRGGVREEDTSSTAAKAQCVKELLFAKKTQATKNAMREWKDLWVKERHGQELYRLEPSPRRRTIKLHCRLSKELSSLVV